MPDENVHLNKGICLYMIVFMHTHKMHLSNNANGRITFLENYNRNLYIYHQRQTIGLSFTVRPINTFRETPTFYEEKTCFYNI